MDKGAIQGWLSSRISDNLVRVLVVASLVFTGVSVYRQSHQNQCFRDYIEDQASISAARNMAAEEDRAALRKLAQEIVLAKQPGDSRNALNEFLASGDEADRSREAHPLLPPPSHRCG